MNIEWCHWAIDFPLSIFVWVFIHTSQVNCSSFCLLIRNDWIAVDWMFRFHGILINVCEASAIPLSSSQPFCLHWVTHVLSSHTNCAIFGRRKSKPKPHNCFGERTAAQYAIWGENNTFAFDNSTAWNQYYVYTSVWINVLYLSQLPNENWSDERNCRKKRKIRSNLRGSLFVFVSVVRLPIIVMLNSELAYLPTVFHFIVLDAQRRWWWPNLMSDNNNRIVDCIDGVRRINVNGK